MNIAICDDDLLYMNQVKEMIEKWGKEHHEDVSIYLFNHGDALINSYQKSHIEVILLDIMMPLLNGLWKQLMKLEKMILSLKLFF